MKYDRCVIVKAQAEAAQAPWTEHGWALGPVAVATLSGLIVVACCVVGLVA